MNVHTHTYTDGWCVGSVLPKAKGNVKEKKGVWVRYQVNGQSEDWLHDCNEQDYGKCWFLLVKTAGPAHSDLERPVREHVTVPVLAGMTRGGTRFDDVEGASKKRNRTVASASKAGAQDNFQKMSKNQFECPVCERVHHFRANCLKSGGSTYHLLHRDKKLRLPINLSSTHDAKPCDLALESQDLTDYEKMRLANMKRNQEILVSLGLATSS